MDTKQQPKASAVQAAGIGERLVHIESRMDFVATREDVALVRTEMANMNADLRTEIERTRTEIANTNTRLAELNADLLTGIAEVKTLVANREASMQRWLLGITGTAMIGLTAALVRTFV